MSVLANLLAAALLAPAAQGRLPTVDTFLHMSAPGDMGVCGQTAVVQTQAPLVDASTYDDERLMEAQLSRLTIWPVARRGASFHVAAVPGPISTDCARMAVMRPRGHTLQLGVLTLATGRSQWLPTTVEPEGLGRSVVWRARDELVVLAPAPHATPRLFQDGAAAEVRLQALWARQRRGRMATASTPFASPPLSDGPRRVQLVNVASGRVRTIARGAFIDIELSPDAQRLALLEVGEPRPLADADALNSSEHLRRTGVALLSLRDGVLARPCSGDALPTLLSWSPDSRTLLIGLRDPATFDWRKARLALASMTTCAPLATGAWLPAVDDDGGENIPRLQTAWVGMNPAARLRAETGVSRWASLAVDRAPVAIDALPRPTPPLFDAARLRLSAPDVRPDAGLQADVADCSAPGVRARICLRTDARGVTLIRLVGGRRRRALTLNGQLSGTQWARITRLDASSGAPHWLYTPAASAGRHPLVVLPYPGTSMATAPARYAPGSVSLITQAQLLAAHGYAVLVPSLPPPHPGRADAGVAQAILQAIAVAARDPRVDACRVAIWGHSFGAYAALITAEAHPRLAAVIAQNALVDLLSGAGETTPDSKLFADTERFREFSYGWSEAGQGRFGARLARGAAAYLAASPLLPAARLTMPLLLINGDQDFIAASQADELAAALRREDRSFELVTFWGEGHVLLSPANHRDLYRRVFRFLDAAFAQAPSIGCGSVALPGS